MTTRGIVVSALLAACSSGNSPVGQFAGANRLSPADATPDAALVAQRVLAVGSSQCPAGGSLVQSGIDSNRNGQLEESEVGTATPLCNPAPVDYPTLTRVDPLAAKDSACGVPSRRISTGLDNGDGGEVARDGVLSPGEVDASSVVCNASDTPVTHYQSAPAGPAGTFRIRSDGGTGSAGAGGAGGRVHLFEDTASVSGAIRVFNTGSVDASFTFPSDIPFDLGNNPLHITQDTVFEAIAGLAIVGQSIEIDGKRVTGLLIDAGTTLTFSGSKTFVLPSDFVNYGHIVTQDSASPNAPSLDITASTFLGMQGSRMTLNGDSADATTDGGNGGSCVIRARTPIDTSNASNGGIFNLGQIEASGGDGRNGGSGGEIYLSSGVSLYNRGNLSSVGGRGLAGAGGAGGKLKLYGEFGSAFNSGDVTSQGGAGTSRGGGASEIELTAYYPGYVYTQGHLTSRGGDADAPCSPTGAVTCSGGDSAQVAVWTWGGDIYMTGRVNTHGGASVGGTGGVGGNIEIGSYTDSAWSATSDSPTTVAGSSFVAADLEASGGDGLAGGRGGVVTIQVDTGRSPIAQEIQLFGVESISSRGGAGTSAGGNAGRIEFEHLPSTPLDQKHGAGGIVVYSQLIADGGAASGPSGIGGDGATILFSAPSLPHAPGLSYCDVFGASSANGGSGAQKAGNGGRFSIDVPDAVTVAGVVSALSGASSAGAPGAAGSADLRSTTDTVEVRASIDVSALANGASIAAASGGEITIEGRHVSVSAALSANGASSAAARGGNGGLIVVSSSHGASEVATTTTSAGSGSPAGSAGRTFIDGF